MSDPENFIARWSRRKREGAVDAERADSTDARAEATSPLDRHGGARPGHPRLDDGAQDVDARPKAGHDEGETAAPAFNPATLPPIESITAQTDIRAFLAPGVPPELTRAALRRVWTADPGIRDFVGLADYDWDFNTPGAIPGFGPLEMTDELRRQVVAMVGRGLAPEPDAPPAPAAAASTDPPPVETSGESARLDAPSADEPSPYQGGGSQVEPAKEPSAVHNSDAPQRVGTADVAVQNSLANPVDVQTIAKRSHGRALPK